MYLRPRNLSELFEMWHAHPEAVPVAGGSRVLPLGPQRPAVLLDLAIAALQTIEKEAQFLTFGPMVSVDRLAAVLASLPGLHAVAQAALGFVPVQVRKQATLGGNLLIGGSLAPALAAVGAIAIIKNHQEIQELPIQSVVPVQPGRLRLPAQTLLVAVRLPLEPSMVSYYAALRRTPVGPAVAAVAVAVVGSGLRLAVGGATPQLQMMQGDLADRAAMDRWLQDLPVTGDPRASAAYRQAMLALLLERALDALPTASRQSA